LPPFYFVSVEIPLSLSFSLSLTAKTFKSLLISSSYEQLLIIFPSTKHSVNLSSLKVFPIYLSVLTSLETMPVSGNYSGELDASEESLPDKLTTKTSFLSLKLYVVIGVLVICAIAVFVAIFLCIRSKRNSRKRKGKMRVKQSSGLIPLVSKEIVEIKALDRDVNSEKPEGKIGNEDFKESEIKIEVEVVKGGGGKKSGESDVSGGSRSDASLEPENIGWGRWYSLKELEVATRGFDVDNVIGEGGYGIVYRGVLNDGSVVAVKNLLNNKYVNWLLFFFFF
jgi:hypothetical protein